MQLSRRPAAEDDDAADPHDVLFAVPTAKVRPIDGVSYSRVPLERNREAPRAGPHEAPHAAGRFRPGAGVAAGARRQQ
jgi:hypothetical protein